jgi:cell division protein FtsB
MTNLEIKELAALREENQRLKAQNERLRDAIEGISQNPEYVQAAGWWGTFAATLGAGRIKLRERIVELERQVAGLEKQGDALLKCGHYKSEECYCEELNRL